jgi:hypothetical protein
MFPIAESRQKILDCINLLRSSVITSLDFGYKCSTANIQVSRLALKDKGKTRAYMLEVSEYLIVCFILFYLTQALSGLRKKVLDTAAMDRTFRKIAAEIMTLIKSQVKGVFSDFFFRAWK